MPSPHQVGPTLDDVTLAGVALALGKPLVRHPKFEERILAMFGAATTPAHLKVWVQGAGGQGLGGGGRLAGFRGLAGRV